MAKSWYAMYVQVGSERKIAKEIELRMLNSDFASLLGKIRVPEKEAMLANDKIVKKKVLPGYILIELDIPQSEEDWLEFKRIFLTVKGFRFFIGPKDTDKPSKISEEEVCSILEKIGEIKTLGVYSNSEYKENQSVKIVDGPFSNFVGLIQEVNQEKQKVKINVQIFGRSTPLELTFNQIKPM